MDKTELWNELSCIMFEAQTDLSEADFHKRLSILAVKAESINQGNLASLCDNLRDEAKSKGLNRRKYGIFYALITKDNEGIAFERDSDMMDKADSLFNEEYNDL